jgi:hypothetical protein
LRCFVEKTDENSAFLAGELTLIGKPRSRFNVLRTSGKALNKIKLHRRQFLGSQGVAESHLEAT